MRVDVGYTTKVESNVTSVLKVLRERQEDFSKPFQQIADEVVFPSLSQSFAAGGRPRWKALKPSYRKWKNRVAPGQPTLTLVGRVGKRTYTGALGKSLRHRTGSNTTIGKRAMLIRTNVFHASIIAAGLPPLAGPRNFMHLTRMDMRAIERILREHVAGLAKEAKKGGKGRKKRG